MYSELDAMYICGDLNSRVGNKVDNISLIDNLSDRQVLDYTVNSHGTALQEFLLDARCCIVNGRVTPEKNEFTFVHQRGRSVVDYFLVGIDSLDTCISCEVITPMRAFDMFCSNSNAGSTGALSDHSVLKLEITTGFCHLGTRDISMPDIHQAATVTALDDSREVSSEHQDDFTNFFYKRFKIETVPNDFMSCDATRDALISLITEMENVMSNQQEIDNIYDKFCQIYHTEMMNYFRFSNIHPNARKRLYRSAKPFWNGELHKLWHDVRQAEHNFVKAKGTQNVNVARQKFKVARNLFDRIYRREERFFMKSRLENLEQTVKNNPREFWKVLKNLGPHKKLNIPFEVYDNDNNVVYDKNSVLNKWKNDYAKLYDSPIETDDFDDEFYNICREEISEFERSGTVLPGLNHAIEKDEVIRIIQNSKNKKSVGLDNLPNEVFKNEASINVLTKFFNRLFETSLIPSVWRKAVLKPIPKGSTCDPRIPLEYRGISLVSTVYKLYSSLLNRRLVSVGEMHNLFADEQNGFRGGRSCEDHCFVLSTIVRQRKQNNLSTFAGFIDLKKAFDCIDRQLLLHKLLKAGISGMMYQNLKCIYTHCETAVNINGFLTDFFDSKFGVRQGDCLSTTLFLLFMNDLADELSEKSAGICNEYFNVKCLMYADDLVFLSETEDDLQVMFNVLSDWCRKWRMKVNTQKTHVIHFRKKRQSRTNYMFKINGETIMTTDKCKYLGLVFQEFLDFKITSDVLAESGGRALGSIYCKYKCNKGFGFDTFTKLYDSGVAPVLDYGSCIWGYGAHENVRSVQNRAIRLYLGVHKFASNLSISGDMGWVPRIVRRKIIILKFWNRLMHMNRSRLTKKVFNWDKDSRAPTWCNDIAEMLDTLNLRNVYTNCLCIDVNFAQDSLLSIHKNEWVNCILDSPKLRTYKMFKSNYDTECYVKLVLNRGHRAALAQFRCGILPLSIETGRFQNIPLEYRLCNFCDQNVIEDETHFLLYCTAYQELRNVLLLKAIEIQPDYIFLNLEDKLQLFMSTKLVKHTARFIYEAISKRRGLLYISV